MLVHPDTKAAKAILNHFRDTTRAAVANRTAFRILERHWVHVFAPNGGGERFATLFREAWKQIPLGPRRAMIGHWRKDPYPLVLLRPEISLLDTWSGRVTPRRIKGDKGLRGVKGCVSADGHRLVFWTKIINAYPDNLVRDLIAHELAHVYQWACGYSQDLSTPYDWEEDADFRMEAWGFDPTAMDEWDLTNGVSRVINLDTLSPAARTRRLNAAARDGR